MLAFCEAVAASTHRFLSTTSKEVEDELRDSVAFNGFCTQLRDRAHAFVVIAASDDEASGISTVECSHSLSATVADLANRNARLSGCVVLQSKPKPDVAAEGSGGDDLSVSGADDILADDGLDDVAGDDDALVLTNVLMTVVDPSEPLTFLLNQLSDIHQPLCHGTTAAVSRAILDLINAVKSHDFLGDFKLERYVHKEIAEAVRSAAPDASPEDLLTALGAKATDKKFVNEVQKLMRDYDEDMGAVANANFNVTSIRDEIALWTSVAEWVDKVKAQTESRDWKLTQLVLRKRFSANLSGGTDPLAARAASARAFRTFFENIPFARVQAATTPGELADAARTVMEKLKDFTTSSFPGDRAARLSDFVANEIAAVAINMLSHGAFLTMARQDRNALLQPLRDALQEAQNGRQQMVDLANSVHSSRVVVSGGHSGKGAPQKVDLGDNALIAELTNRITVLSELVDEHEVFAAAVKKVFRVNDPSGVVDATTSAFEAFSGCAIIFWKFDEAAVTRFNTSLAEFRSTVAAIETSICALMSAKFAACTAASENFRVYDEFEPLRHRRMVRDAASTFRMQMVQQVKTEIRHLMDRYRDDVASRNAAIVASSRGVSAPVAAMQWGITTLSRLDEMLRRRSSVSEHSYERLLTLRGGQTTWQFNETLARFVGVPLTKLSELKGNRTRVDPAAWGTAVAIAYLELAFGRDAADWRRLASEALKFLNEVDQRENLSLLTTAINFMKRLGAGSQVAQDQQDEDHFRRFRQQVVDDVTERAATWTAQCRKRIESVQGYHLSGAGALLRGELISTVLTVKQAADRTYHFAVGYPMFVGDLARDEAELNACGIVQHGKSRTEFLHGAEPEENWSHVKRFLTCTQPAFAQANTLQSLLQMYYTTTKRCDPDVLVLLASDDHALTKKLAEGVKIKWSSNDAKYFVRDVSGIVRTFCESARSVSTWLKRYRETVVALRRCEPEASALKTWVGRIKTAMAELGRLAPKNRQQWIARVLPDIEDALLAHLRGVVDSWHEEFNLLDPEARANAESIRAERRNASPEDPSLTGDLARRFGLVNMPTAIRHSQQSTRLDPQIVACRRFWYGKLNEALGIVCDLPHVTDTQTNFHYLVARLPAGLLSGAFHSIDASLAKVSERVEVWSRLMALWDVNRDVLCEELGDDVCDWLVFARDVQEEGLATVGTMQTEIELPGFTLSSADILQGVAGKHQTMVQMLNGEFRRVLGQRMHALYKIFKEEHEALEPINVTGSVKGAVTLLAVVPRLEDSWVGWEADLALLTEGEQFLAGPNRRGLGGDWLYSERVQSEYDTLRTVFARKRDEVESRRAALQEHVQSDASALAVDIDRLDQEFSKSGLEDGSAPVKEAHASITKYHEDAEALRTAAKRCAGSLRALGIDTTLSLGQLDRVAADIDALKDVFDALLEHQNAIDTLGESRFARVDGQAVQNALKGIEAKLFNMPSSMQTYRPFKAMKVSIQRLLGMGTIVTDLASEIMRPESWRDLAHELNKAADWVNDLTLAKVWEADPMTHDQLFKKVIAKAQAEMTLKSFLAGIKGYWEEAALEIGSFQGKVNLVKGWDVMFEKLNEHLGSVSSMRLSPHFAFIKADANVVDDELNQVRLVLDTLVDVQRRWVYLQGIFGASADIRQQLPVESSHFEKTTREFFGVMPKPKKGQMLTIMAFAAHDNKLLPTLEKVGRELTSVQRALGDYLEAQRASFARFYFVGDEDLLEVIGNGKSPVLIAKHLRKMFGGIAALQLEKDTKITAIVSGEGETVALPDTIDADGQKVNDWLGQLAQGMVGALATNVNAAISEMPEDPAGVVAWIGKFANQVVCIALQARWTSLVEAAMQGKGCDSVADTMAAILDVLAQSVLSPDLHPILRAKIEQIITVAVYQRDASRALAACKASATSFEWLSRLRLYSSKDPAPGAKEGPHRPTGVDCRMADASFGYSYEYLGICDRLVQTPLTDKCYLTLTQALHTKLGGSPSGPAGTGKTETVKALGAQLGRFVLVFCCDEAFDFKSMGRIFVGLCQVGAWGCFDEFNRLEERILSAVSQQIQTIQEGLRDSVSQVELVERKVQLHSNVGVFITMNPGYAGRSPLPDNLKQLFRAVAMSAPDRENIAEVMLFAQGFRTAEALSRKVVPLFKLCKDQLSPQSHYDFGLRALKSVLISAGSLKRTATAAGKGAVSGDDETRIMIQALVETMVPKLVASDAALFFPLLRDVFPGFEPDASPLTALRAAVEKQAARNGLVMSDAWVSKIEQLYKILQVNHGVMLVGASGTGKTAAWTTLLYALAELEDVDGHAYVIDPKALTKAELYGVLDPTTRDWRDGVFTATLRRIIDNLKGDDQSKKRHWILFDGDVDPEWVENLNSLLDDNRLLTLPNGERLALPSNVRIVFEVQDLRYATLATVSRCGMVWFSEDTTPVENYIAEFRHNLRNVPLSQRGTSGTTSFFAERRSVAATKKSSGTAQHTAEQQAELALQAELLRVVDEELGAKGLVTESVARAEEFLARKGIMEWSRLQALRAVFSLFARSVSLLQQRTEKMGQMDPDVFTTFTRRRLAFALSWGLASGCSIDTRNAFSEHLALPDTPKGSVYDYDIALEDAEWVLWRDRVPPTDLPANKVGTNDVVIPTVDTARHESVIAAWLDTGKPVILCGPPGSGKTMSLTAVLRSSPDYDCAFLNFSSATTSHTVLKLLEEYATYKNTMKGMVLTPVSGKRLIIFCDEINLPAADKYGTQQVVQLLRQMTERQGFYRAKDNTWVTLENIQFAGACNPPTDPGRTPMTPRFLRWAPVLFVDFPSYESLLQIYNTYCRALLHKNTRLRAVSDCLARAMVDVFKGAQKRFTPDQQAHYVYSPRELSRWSRAVFEGLASLDDVHLRAMLPEGLVRLAVHEGLRLFRDRLVAESEQKWIDDFMDECFTNAFPGLDTTCLQRPILFTTILTRAYTSVDLEDLRKHVQERLKMFADEEMDVQLVVFDSMLDHLIRIDRVMRQPLGHMLLAGASGVGKTVLSKFAAWLSNMSVFQIKAHRGYTLKDFEDDLRTLMKRAGCKREKIVFLFDESNIMDSGFLEYMNALLASAEVPGLFDGEEWSQLIHNIREGINSSGQTEHVDQTVETELYRWFISQVAQNLHVVFTMNPANAEFGNRAATSPALFNRCTIDWFGNWNSDTMTTVARELTARLDVADANPEAFTDAESAHAALATCIYKMHAHVDGLNERLRADAGNRGTFITPRHFLDFIGHFQGLFKSKKLATQELQRHLQGGLGKLRDTAEKVNEQQAMLRVKESELAESSAKAQKMLSQLIEEKSKAETAKKQTETLAEQLLVESKEIDERRSKAEEQLSQAQPALDDAAAALSTIKKEDLREIRAYSTPPAMIRKILEAVLTTLGVTRASDWDVIKQKIRDDSFITSVRDFKPSQLTEELKEKIKVNFVDKEGFDYETGKRASKATGPLVKWVIAQVRFADIHVSIKPLREEIAKLAAAHEEKAAGLTKAEEDVGKYEATLLQLQEDYSDMMQQNNTIKAEITSVKSRCDRATALVENLTSERDRWETQAANFRTEMTAVLGDSLISSAFLAYIGYFDEQVRKKQILPEWYDIIDSSRILFRPRLALTEYLSRPEKRMQWAANKLPQDDLCIENAIILDRFRRYPLVIDPSGQAADFLAAEFAGRKLTKTSFLEKNFLKQLELCVRFGTPCIINDVEHMDPVLNPLLNREVRRAGGRNLVRLGPQDIDISPQFTMILTTRDNSFQFAPDVAGRVTMVNFTVTPSVLQSQVLHLVLQHERPDIEQKRSDLLKLQGEYTLKLRVLEDELLTAIASSEGMILENETLIKTLENLKEQVATVTQKMDESAAAFADIHSVEDACKPTAEVASRMFFSLDQLAALSPTYGFSLRFFFGVIDASLAGLPEGDFYERLRFINRKLFGVLNSRVSRSMYHEDHRTWHLRLAQLRCSVADEVGGKVPQAWWDMLLGRGISGATESDASALPACVPATVPLQERLLLASFFADPLCHSVVTSANQDTDAWAKFAAGATGDLPEAAFGAMAPAVAGLARAILAKALRPSEFNNATDRFITALFDATEDLQRLGMPAFLSTVHLYDIQAVLPELDGGTPLLLLSTPGYDASHKVEIIAREQRIRLKAIAMGSGEAIDEASVALHSAMQAGTWVLLKNVHLCPAYLDDLEKRVHTARLEGSSHTNFRLVLASETTSKLPRSLVHGSRILTFEPPPGIKSSLMRTFASAAATLPQHPAETSRLTFVAAWLHAVIVERTRYVPLGWSKRYEFSEADFHRTASTVSAWLQQAAGGRHNIAPTDIPWTAIRTLVRDTVYGGKIDNPCDLELIDSLTTTYLCPAVFSPSFKFEGDSLTCEHFTKEDLVGWISQLPDVEPPEWLGLPASATTMVLEQAAHRTIKKLQDVQVSVLADSAASGDAEDGRGPAWMIKLGSVIDTIANLVPTEKIASIASPDPTDPIQLALQREIGTGNSVLTRVQRDLQELRAIVKGDQKPTNHARALIDVLMHDTTPPRWHPYPLAANLPLTAWASDLSHRVGFLGKLAQNGGNGNINLGALFHPGAFVTATRQLVARKTTKSLEVLRLVCSVNAPPSPLTFAMEGVTLIGADVNQNGALVASGSTGTDVVLGMTWTSEADDAKTATRCAVPLYLNSQRTELIALCNLPIEGTAQSFTLQGVCLSSWRQR